MPIQTPSLKLVEKQHDCKDAQNSSHEELLLVFLKRARTLQEEARVHLLLAGSGI